MSSTRVSPPGFVTVRGRGYWPKQVEAYTAALSAERNAAWERVARLTVFAKEMVVEAERLREAVARIGPQAYDSLGERARRVFELVQEEAADVRERARREAEEQVAQAEARAASVRRAAQEEADAIRAEAREHTRRRMQAMRAEAHGIRVSARHKVKEFRSEALAALREVRQGTAGLLVEPKKEQAERWAAAEREAVERAAALDAHHARAVARAEETLAEAQREFAAAEESSRQRQEEARALAAQILAEARLKEDRIARETERVLRKHSERWDDVQAHMDQVQDSLRALTGGTVK
ncbi:cellulose-binding protein [Streptomyces sp. NBC_01275]|uniref:cellulose-binding protein n=1 Tax=Streptomyces sp. NBC_01275 TaxID=2903807 RepID=UPI00225314F0|nr:cellulose-binding protein [Streptomyces sp. NBC_01275]MCX4762689.1 cellulose-binding protein [Streptomyces sp. NBC_01275]